MNNNEKSEKLKKIILALHQNENVDEARADFKENFASISADEIADLEQNLIESGELTAAQVTNLCDLHVEVFKESIDIPDRPDLTPGHPLHTYRKENAYLKDLIHELRQEFSVDKMIKLAQVETHYTRLENQLFPKLEEKGFTGPSQVMWTKHDEIREMFKARDVSKMKELLKTVEDMITKEEKILFPTSLQKLSENDWVAVKNGEEEIGFAWIKPGTGWSPITPESLHQTNPEIKLATGTNSSDIPLLNLSTGVMSLEILNIMLKTLPVDLSVINTDDEVIYYSDVPERIFPRSPGVIGRKVINCHPPKSHHIVKRILDAFKKGEKDVAEFWIPLGDLFVYIRYFALRNDAG